MPHRCIGHVAMLQIARITGANEKKITKEKITQEEADQSSNDRLGDTGSIPLVSEPVPLQLPKKSASKRKRSQQQLVTSTETEETIKDAKESPAKGVRRSARIKEKTPEN
eukprot:CAMPEP_0170090518 /NCGR_PEP_ID=MMETSP0019_2-20121128/24359_1 /TAXON_ID=98059 /ORGANISM="Dinobryon sp., Strain UTEXLB2267" /LENGTH=109 /DNA_ID=CAMNT_0010309975 /DNA_START=214 /DNA_END=544 /DNA_ORIENTATION=-